MGRRSTGSATPTACACGRAPRRTTGTSPGSRPPSRARRLGPSAGSLGCLLLREREVARGEITLALLLEQRFLLGADGLHLRAARVEAAGGWRIRGARHVATRDDALLAGRARPVCNRHRRQK